MRRFFLLAFIICLTLHLQSQSFDHFLKYLNSLPLEKRQSKTDSFFKATTRLPFMDSDSNCTIIWKGIAKEVKIAGDFTGWSPTLSMELIEGTDCWYHSTHFEPDARLDYKLVINGTDWIPDPTNPFICSGGFGSNSELRMPLWKSHPETSFNYIIAHGTLIDTVFRSSIMGNSRIVKIYLPAGYPETGKRYPLILFHDGPDYLGLAKAKNLLDNLITNKLIQPVIALFVEPIDRNEEYNGKLKDAFSSFIMKELMPYIDNHYETSMNPAQRAMAGASSGGNISLYIGMKYPDLFGKIAAQSSSVEEIISDTFLQSPKMNLNIYLDIGTYDIPRIIVWVRNLKNVLDQKGYSFQYHEWHEGHSWGNWRDHLALPLIQFFAP
ncbi:MAG: alpha/beta hydrolase-fold protein [Bacteroidota bacterium]